MHLILTGSRDWPQSEWRIIHGALYRLREAGMTLLAHGDCPTGVDRAGDVWARAECFPCARMPAWFEPHGSKAGPLRNGWLLEFFPTADVLAFPLPGSKGTVDCIRQARALGRRVWVYGEAT